MKGVDNPEFHEILKSRFGIEDFPKDAPPFVPASRHRAVTGLLASEHGYTLYDFVVASHWPAVVSKKEDDPGDPEHYEVTTGLRSVTRASKLAVWRVRVEIDGTMPSIVDLFAGADWQEREQFDLVGVRFSRHPDMRRIMLPEDWDGHPLRRDYAIDTPHPPWR